MNGLSAKNPRAVMLATPIDFHPAWLAEAGAGYADHCHVLGVVHAVRDRTLDAGGVVASVEPCGACPGRAAWGRRAGGPTGPARWSVRSRAATTNLGPLPSQLRKLRADEALTGFVPDLHAQDVAASVVGNPHGVVGVLPDVAGPSTRVRESAWAAGAPVRASARTQAAMIASLRSMHQPSRRPRDARSLGTTG